MTGGARGRGPGRRARRLVDARRGRRRSACRSSSSRIRTRRATSGANAESSSRPARAILIADEAFDAEALLEAAEPARGPGAPRRDARGRPRARPARRGRRPSPSSCWRWPSARAAARRRRDDRATLAGGRVTDAARAARPRAGVRRVRLGTDIQRRLGVKTSRDEPLARFTTMRVGGPADLFAVAHNAFELRGARPVRPVARDPAHASSGAAATSSSATPGSAASSSRTGPRARASTATGYVAEAGVPMARAATETQKAGLTGLEFGLAIPGTVGGAVWANAGAHDSRRGGDPRVGVGRSLGDGREAVLAADGARLRATATAGSRTRRRHGRRPPRSSSGDVPARARRRRRDQGRASTRSAAGARRTSRSACRRPARVFRNPPTATRPAR